MIDDADIIEEDANWNQIKLIMYVAFQAMAPAQVATDRYCIASGGRHNIRLSTQEILDCAIMRYRRGCKGG